MKAIQNSQIHGSSAYDPQQYIGYAKGLSGGGGKGAICPRPQFKGASKFAKLKKIIWYKRYKRMYEKNF